MVIVAIVVAALVGVFVFASGGNNSQNGGSSAQASSHTQGAGNKGVTLVEYGDFQCPACRQFYPLLKQVKEEYGDDITFQFRNFPLTQIHPNAMAAHRAAEAAGKQGKFFEMHDLMYENQDSWSPLPDPTSIFEGFAKQLNLDIAVFNSDVASEEVAATINADIKAGQEAGANSTPTFVINGQKIENPKSLDEFKRLIDEAIAGSGQ